MKYTIITLNDDRKDYFDVIRRHAGYEEIRIPAVDGRDVDLFAEMQKRVLFKDSNWHNAKRGELGVWLSNFDRWAAVADMDEPLIVFEDDAVIDETFKDKAETMLADLPDDWDFFALWVPENQTQDFLYHMLYNQRSKSFQMLGYTTPEQSVYRVEGSTNVALVYQGYGMVALMYSPEGGKNLVRLARETGIYMPVDCWIFEEAKKGNLKGYAPRPDLTDIVSYDWQAVSHVQLTEMA